MKKFSYREIPGLENVKIYTKLMYVYCIMYTAKDKKGHINVSLTLIFKVNSQGEVNYFGLFVITDLEKVRMTPRSSLYHVCNHAELKRSYKS